jgi:tetratricopeptide (TPR) repeat protein
VVFFCAAGFLASAGLLRALGRRYFAEVGVGVMGAGTLALGLAPGLPVMMARSDVYEVSISCGYALTMLAVAAIWRALHEANRRSLWLAAASLAYGLAVGARPALLFGAVILLMSAVQAWRAGAAAGSRRQIWVLFLAAAGPIMLIGMGLMLYNDLRFGSPLEFGQRYQLAAERQDTMQHFSPRYLWFNFRVYFLEPARWSGHFPFVQGITSPRLPAGHAKIEHPFGVLASIPLVWLALAAPLAWRGRPAAAGSTLRWLLASLVLLFGVCALTLGLYNYACVRYEVEFVPALVLLAVIGILGLERALAGQPAWRHTARWGWGLLLAWSVAFNLFARFELYAETQNNLGDALLQNGRVNEAITCFQKALHSQPDSANAYNHLGVALLQTGRVDEAMVYYQKALALQPDFAEAHNNLGNALLQKGSGDEAIAHFQKALELQSDYANARYNLGNALVQKGRVDEAISHYQQVLKIQPGFAEAHNNLGSLLLQKGQVDEAMAHFRTALEIQPDNATAQYNLGAALLQKGQVKRQPYNQ